MTAGPRTAAPADAAAPTAGSTPKLSVMAAAPAAGAEGARGQLHLLIGGGGGATRSMLRKRPGRPRSATRKPALREMDPRAVTEARRAKARSPATRAPNESIDDAPASPPVKK